MGAGRAAGTLRPEPALFDAVVASDS